MARQDVNQALLQTSFLYGANSAYIEALQAQYQKDPQSVEAGWREFFAALGDDPASVAKTERGASWRKPNWPATPKGELISATDRNMSGRMSAHHAATGEPASCPTTIATWR